MTLYKYVIPDRIDVLRDLRVRFTHPRGLNDLLELRPSFGQLLTPAEAIGHLIENPLDIATISRRAYEELPPELRSALSLEDMERFTAEKIASPEGHMAVATFATAALAMMNSLTPQMRQLLYDQLVSLVGVFSLTESWDNGPMWAHYAANNTGFLLGFDSKHPFFNRRRSGSDEFYHLRKVVYSSTPSQPRAVSDLANAPSVFLTKDPRWSYEQEWRMVVPLVDATTAIGDPADPIHLFRLPAHAIESVVLGVRSTSALERDIKALLATPGPLAHGICLPPSTSLPLVSAPAACSEGLSFPGRHGLIAFQHAKDRGSSRRELRVAPSGGGAGATDRRAGAADRRAAAPDRGIGEAHRGASETGQAAGRPLLKGGAEREPETPWAQGR